MTTPSQSPSIPTTPIPTAIPTPSSISPTCTLAKIRAQLKRLGGYLKDLWDYQEESSRRKVIGRLHRRVLKLVSELETPSGNLIIKLSKVLKKAEKTLDAESEKGAQQQGELAVFLARKILRTIRMLRGCIS